jgi:hypothetical protein
MIEEMQAAGVHVIVEHIYRDFNKAADKYANVAVDTRASREWHSPQ